MSHFWNFHKYSITPLSVLQTINVKAVPTVQSLAFYSIPGSTGTCLTVPISSVTLCLLVVIIGHIVLLVMVLMYSSAVESIRRPMFEIFWFTHHLFILYYGVLSFHGAAGTYLPVSPFFYSFLYSCITQPSSSLPRLCIGSLVPSSSI